MHVPEELVKNKPCKRLREKKCVCHKMKILAPILKKEGNSFTF